MSDRIADFLLAQSRRERLLLGLLVGVVFPLALGFLWVAPQIEKQRTAQRQAAAAIDMRNWVQQQVAEVAAIKKEMPQSTTDQKPTIGISGIEETLRGADLRADVTRLSNREGGGVELAFDRVEFSVMARWLDQNAQNWGYDIRNFRFEQTDRDGIIAAEFLLEPQQ